MLSKFECVEKYNTVSTRRRLDFDTTYFGRQQRCLDVNNVVWTSTTLLRRQQRCLDVNNVVTTVKQRSCAYWEGLNGRK